MITAYGDPDTRRKALEGGDALIILIGHSMGGFCVLKFSEILQTENIPVSFAVTIDPPQVSPPVPPNIERYLNIFLSKSVLGGSHIKPA